MAKTRHSPFDSALLRTACIVFSLSLVGTSAAAMSLREMRALVKDGKQGENYASYYLVGAMEGALEAHDHMVRSGAKPSMCLQGLRLEPHMARSLFDNELQRNGGVYEADMSVQLVLTNALKSKHPC